LVTILETQDRALGKLLDKLDSCDWIQIPKSDFPPAFKTDIEKYKIVLYHEVITEAHKWYCLKIFGNKNFELRSDALPDDISFKIFSLYEKIRFNTRHK